ncbi:hypothetical protein [Alistipes onderdonkii]|uniref:hypothetical protein n=1 Tax=Alistipes onderdonkii TaxID=328813 RepID=UPI0036F1CE6E
MKKRCKLIVVLLLTGALCGGCTLSETEIIECNLPPQNRDSVLVHPWNPHEPEIPSVGN